MLKRSLWLILVLCLFLTACGTITPTVTNTATPSETTAAASDITPAVTATPIAPASSPSTEHTAGISPSPTSKPTERIDEKSYVITKKIKDNMPPYRFVITGICTPDSPQASLNGRVGNINSVCVYDEKGKIVFSLNIPVITDWDNPGYNSLYEYSMDTMGLHVEDFNFDGYQDFIFLKEDTRGKSDLIYYCYLWDPKASTFVEEKSFSDIYTPNVLDKKNKGIYSTISHYVSGHEYVIYRYIDGEFVLTNSLFWRHFETEDMNDYYIEKELIDGEMKEIRKVPIIPNKPSIYQNDELWQLGKDWFVRLVADAEQLLIFE